MGEKIQTSKKTFSQSRGGDNHRDTKTQRKPALRIFVAGFLGVFVSLWLYAVARSLGFADEHKGCPEERMRIILPEADRGLLQCDRLGSSA
jgi:hypothetical protein